MLLDDMSTGLMRRMRNVCVDMWIFWYVDMWICECGKTGQIQRTWTS